MKRPRRLPTALLCLVLNVACGSDDSSGGRETACVPGHAVACRGVDGCVGAQSCDESGERYENCVCDGEGSETGSGGITSGGRSSGTSPVVTSPAGGAQSTSSRSEGGTSFTSVTNGGANVNGTEPNVTCTPKDMSGFSYPSYHPAIRKASACTDGELEAYFTDCYSAGNCNAFEPGGPSAGCGDCLLPTSLGSPSYGPLLKLGSDTAYLSSTNLAGCIELVGEPACAAKIQIAQLCEYHACEHCGPSGSGSYRAQMDCMTEARGGVCASAQTEAICIQSSAHVAACSGSSSKTQFSTVAKVFCQ